MAAQGTGSGNQANSSVVLELQEAFKAFDKNGDGEITAEELGDVMRSLGLNPTDSELKDMIGEVDVDNTGSIDIHEFVTMMSHKLADTDYDQELRDAFRVFDRDGSGTISTDELKKVMVALGEDLSDAEIEQMMQEADVDRSGTVDFEEFAKLMKGK
ncbi:hypothetical protein M409DRAFT_28235 [Zasmidium cellare ATCC 36951]|uniref:Calmodulin n=1 Tax=Zasmidium cellare ATCC 36951 TaxID=1080233 RepID=A0A6A6C5H1_ZASCE|nr:uncharacterized protein M409DRAFT_28235 [Zasmidium cellare ATCC 36951]KAF2161508.1 hypothetical protein M409DRAFT_28235 [Zasmidium cellare ATCC 36951]